jgi:ubiquinone/menaquinone biosynthesis C-methylase UbiE
MDGETLSFVATERALADLRRVNGLLLGYGSVVRTLLPRLLRERGPDPGPQILLDLGTGSGDVAAAVQRAARRRGILLQPLGVDIKLRHLAIGRRRHPEQWHVVASAEALPFAQGAVDWSLSTLFFHHFGGPANRRIVTEMCRVTRRAVGIIDLRRSALLRWFLGPLLRLLGVSTVARIDGEISARHAWSLSQVRTLGTTLGLAPEELRRRFPFRFSWVLPGCGICTPRPLTEVQNSDTIGVRSSQKGRF